MARLVVVDLGNTLDYLHRAGIVHRDVQPGNVMIRAENGTISPTLIDFGLVGTLRRQPNGLVEDYGRRAAHRIYGAPEAQDGGAVTARADQWSLAATLLSTYVGHDIYRTHWGEAIHKANFPSALLSDATTLTSMLRPTEAEALRKATSFDPAQRFESCSAFVSALRS